jgi:hypothetical protein
MNQLWLESGLLRLLPLVSIPLLEDDTAVFVNDDARVTRGKPRQSRRPNAVQAK